MSYTITPENEGAFLLYQQQRDRVRAVMAGGVYPNLKVALREYGALGLMLAEADECLQAYHAEVSGPVQAYIGQIQAALLALAGLIENAEATSPGLFDIQIGGDG